MSTVIFQAEFVGVRVKIQERTGLPKGKVALSLYVEEGYKLVTIEVTAENPHTKPCIRCFRFVTFKPLKDARILSTSLTPYIVGIGPNDVILGVKHTVDSFSGRSGDVMTFTLCDLTNLHKRRVPVFIAHHTPPQLPYRA